MLALYKNNCRVFFFIFLYFFFLPAVWLRKEKGIRKYFLGLALNKSKY